MFCVKTSTSPYAMSTNSTSGSMSLYKSSTVPPRRSARRDCTSASRAASQKYIDLVRAQSTYGTHSTTSYGESPAHTSECTGRSDPASCGNWMLRLIWRCIASSLPTSVSSVRRASAAYAGRSQGSPFIRLITCNRQSLSRSTGIRSCAAFRKPARSAGSGIPSQSAAARATVSRIASSAARSSTAVLTIPLRRKASLNDDGSSRSNVHGRRASGTRVIDERDQHAGRRPGEAGNDQADQIQREGGGRQPGQANAGPGPAAARDRHGCAPQDAEPCTPDGRLRDASDDLEALDPESRDVAGDRGLRIHLPLPVEDDHRSRAGGELRSNAPQHVRQGG